MRIAFLALPLLLSGCGVIEMVASGVADGTKFVINRVENDPQVQETRRQQGYAPARGQDLTAPEAVPAQPYPDQTRPSYQSGGATAAPAPLAAPVTPVTRGEPL
ncbi:hypothetical protein JL101_019685 [Skermanella rosea]|uniref:hypothetical protein n=1 Tax=Skermanella rosea TaxID=1817965 RepID=UPI0019313A1E|nr:hypothetical protein [Skermanella rosea]UEM02206.1 hypothetical protein JL101_019685 [Skermanella rosea]